MLLVGMVLQNSSVVRRYTKASQQATFLRRSRFQHIISRNGGQWSVPHLMLSNWRSTTIGGRRKGGRWSNCGWIICGLWRRARSKMWALPLEVTSVEWLAMAMETTVVPKDETVVDRVVGRQRLETRLDSMLSMPSDFGYGFWHF